MNKYAKTEEYPLPRIEDLFAALSGGQEFTKLDLANAYLQLPLEDKSRQYVTIEYTQKTVQVQQASVWCSISTCNLPENYREFTPRNEARGCLH